MTLLETSYSKEDKMFFKKELSLLHSNWTVESEAKERDWGSISWRSFRSDLNALSTTVSVHVGITTRLP